MRETLRAFFILFLFFSSSGCQYNHHIDLSGTVPLSGIIQLTDGFSRAGEACFSPDSRWILFRALQQNKPQYELFSAKITWNQGELTGIEKPTRVTSATARGESGTFSPDGLLLIFSVTTPASAIVEATEKFPPEMHLFRFDGWEGAVSMTDYMTGIDLAQHPLFPDHTYNGQCKFSPDGKHIVFTSAHNGYPNLYIAHPDGSHRLQLTNTLAADTQASFSPNGKELIYCSDRNSKHLEQIYLADLTFDPHGEVTGVTDQHALTYDDSTNTNPAWNPDGKHIIYATSRHGAGNYELYLMDHNGRKKSRLTYFEGADLFPVFSPDGRYVMWTSKRAKDGTIQVFVANFQFPLGA